MIILFSCSTTDSARLRFGRSIHSLRRTRFLILQSCQWLIPKSIRVFKHTFWYLLMARTTAIKASSTFTRCLADVSIHWALNLLAKSRPSEMALSCEWDLETNGLTMRLDLPFVLQITFIRYYDYWEVVLILNLSFCSQRDNIRHVRLMMTHPQNLLMECRYFFERASGSNGVNKEETLSYKQISVSCHWELYASTYLSSYIVLA